MSEKQTPQDNDQIEDSFDAIFNDHAEMQTSDIAAIARRYEAQHAPESDIIEKPKFTKALILTGVALAGVATAGIAGIASLEGGNNNGESVGATDVTIESITLNPEANLRFDPYIGEGEEDNSVLQLGAAITIDVNHDVQVLNNTNNGTWYGVPMAHIQEVVPTINTSDKDGIIWVNWQGVENILHTEIETK